MEKNIVGELNLKFVQDGLDVHMEARGDATIPMLETAINSLTDKMLELKRAEIKAVAPDNFMSFGEFLRAQIEEDLANGVISKEYHDELIDASALFNATAEDPSGVADLVGLLDLMSND